MFYSATLLGRKGPLAIVWQAATIQSTLKKSQYASTDIPSTVELIMSPSIPFALRQSAYLLLGVVRIHSKQVEYFFQECKNLETRIREAFLPTNINLPEDATHASFNSITLPQTFELDAFCFNDDLDLNRFEDTHLVSSEEITLEDQNILSHEDHQYVAIFVDEDKGKSWSKSGEASGVGATPMEIDSFDPSNVDGIPSPSQNSYPETEAALLGGNVLADQIPQEIPGIEIMCNVVHHDHGSNDVSLWTDGWNEVMEPDRVLEELIMKEKETTGLVEEETMHCDEPPSATSAEIQESTNTQICFGHQSIEIVLRSTPPPKEPKSRRRGRKLQIDDDAAIELSKDETRALRDDPSPMKRRRKDATLSSLDMWKLNKGRRRDGMFFEPLLTGLSDDLCNIYKEDFVSAKIKMVSSEEEDHAEPSGNHSPPPGNDLGIEIEKLRDNQEFACTNLLSGILPSPNFASPPMSTSSPSRRDDFTPSTWYREGVTGVENTVLSDISEFDSPAEDLSFLDQDDRTPIDELRASTSSNPMFDTLPARTRSLAQYLQGKSPVTPISEDTGEISLNTILEGKSKKICARMFFETLVLENCGLVNANQNEPYGDITLKVTSRLNERFSS